MNKTLQTLLKARDDYYKDGTSNLSDKEYDDLLDKLKEEDEDLFLQFNNEVGSDLNEHWKKFQHQYKMGSLSKCNTFDEFKDWSKKFKGGFIIEEKLDGISIALYYEEGKLVRGVSRGDGEKGDEITRNVLKMKGVPKTIKHKGEFVVRGEIVLKHSVWEKMPADKKGKNPRNTAAGAAKKLDGSLCEYLNVIAYDIMNFEEKDQTDFLLKNYGFDPAFRKLCDTEEEVWEVFREYEEGKRDNLDWDIDGLVIKTQKVYPEEDWRKPKNAIAWKFSHQYVETFIDSIEWQTSGERVNPVAHFRPVECAGVTISKASLHNWKFIQNLGAGKGCKVLISRRNDVIPHVEEVLEKPKDFVLPQKPEKCPCCGGKVQFAKNIEGKDLEYLVCTNLECPAKVVKNVMKWFETHDCKGVAERTVELLFENLGFTNLAEFFHLSLSSDKIILGLEGMGSKKLDNLKKQILSTKETSIEKFLGGLNLPNFGKRMFRKIVDHLKNQKGEVTIHDTLSFINDGDLSDVEGFSDNSDKTLKREITKAYPMISEMLQSGFSVQKEEKVCGGFDGVSFCFTGSLDTMKRKEAEELVVGKGGKISSVNKTLTYLVTNDTSSGSSKNKKAQDLGVKIITEAQFRDILGI